MTRTRKDPAAVSLGRKGGLAKSKAKRAAAKINSKKGGEAMRAKAQKNSVDKPKRLGL